MGHLKGFRPPDRDEPNMKDDVHDVNYPIDATTLSFWNCIQLSPSLLNYEIPLTTLKLILIHPKRPKLTKIIPNTESNEVGY